MSETDIQTQQRKLHSYILDLILENNEKKNENKYKHQGFMVQKGGI